MLFEATLNANIYNKHQHLKRKRDNRFYYHHYYYYYHQLIKCIII